MTGGGETEMTGDQATWIEMAGVRAIGVIGDLATGIEMIEGRVTDPDTGISHGKHGLDIFFLF